MSKKTTFFLSMNVLALVLGLAWGFLVDLWVMPGFVIALLFMVFAALSYFGYAVLEVAIGITVPMGREGAIFIAALMLVAGFLVLWNPWGMFVAALVLVGCVLLRYL